MRLDAGRAASAIRLSLGRTTTEIAIEQAAQELARAATDHDV
jgi:cysteine sulfinate desulfinase/cysteine desulfurase-like protein